MKTDNQAENPRNDQRRHRLLATALTAWDLHRTRDAGQPSERRRLMAFKAHDRLRQLSEAELGVPKHQRSFLKVGQGDVGVLLIHGSDQSPANLVPLARTLHDDGLTVHGLLLADYGHGVADRPEARWRATLQQVRQGHRLLADTGLRVHVIGVGFGAALALHLAERERVESLVLVAPALLPRVGLGVRLLQGLKLLRVPPIRRRLGLLVDVFDGMHQAQNLAGRVNVPMFGIQCDDDTRVSPQSLRLLQKKAKHRRCKFQAFPEGGHDVLEAHGGAGLDQDILRFIRDNA